MAIVLAPTSNANAAQTKTYRFGVWRVEMKHDAFTGQNSCRMLANDMQYSDHIVSFKFGRSTQTDAAILRINGGDVVKAEAYQSDVRSSLLFYDPGPLDNPGGGQVQLPEKLLDDATYVDIRPNPKTRVKHFKLDGFASALAFVQERDCPVTSEN